MKGFIVNRKSVNIASVLISTALASCGGGSDQPTLMAASGESKSSTKEQESQSKIPLPGAGGAVEVQGSNRSTLNDVKELAQLEIYATSIAGNSLNASRLKKISFCSKNGCFDQVLSGLGEIKEMTPSDAPAKIATVSLPAIKIERIIVSADGSNGNARVTEAALKEPIDLVDVVNHAKILITLSDKNAAGEAYVAIENAAGVYSKHDATYLFYHPAIGLNANISNLASISIPKGSIDEPVIFSVAAQDIGEDYPQVDIYPYVALKKAATITLARKSQSRVVKSFGPFNTPKPSLPSANAGAASVAGVASGPISVEFNKTGLFNESVAVDELKKAKKSLEKAAGADACANLLSVPANQAIINNDINITGAVIINWCVNQAPNVHIMLVEARDSREKVELAYGSQIDFKYSRGNLLALQRIYKYRNFQVLINGFTWNYDEGTGTDQLGAAKGYAKGWDFNANAGRITIGENTPAGNAYQLCIVRGLTCTHSTATDGAKRIVDFASDQQTIRSWQTNSSIQEYWPSSSVVISSSTSIVNQGNCASDTLESRWSAFGSTPQGRLVFMSNTSSGTTDTVELCKVFKALGVTNAIRMDGGPSASMMIDNVHVNPLSGLYRIKYGDARYIAYAFGAAWKGYGSY
ncbi:MAG: phosphodiester glycosidase family protein [Acidovorax sp.]